MNTSLTSSSGLTPHNYNYLKLWFTLIYDGKQVFQHIFLWGFQKPPTEIKTELFRLPNYSNSKYRSDFDATQRMKIEEGNILSFDLNLFYLLLQRLCSLPGPSDPLWSKSGDPETLPNVLYTIKMKRNTLAHTNIEITEIEMMKEIDELKMLLNKALDLGVSLFKVSPSIATDIKDKINIHILSIQTSNAVISQQNMKQIAEEKALFALNESQSDLFLFYKDFSKVLLAPWTVAETFQNVKDVFTEPLIKQTRSNVLFQQLTEEESIINTKDILTTKLPDGSIPNFLLIISQSGMGKTTLVKYIIQSWVERSSYIEGLDSVDLVFYYDCRGSRIKSFDEFMASMIPNTVKLFDKNELKIIIITMQVLVILDNVDEITDESLSLYEELLYLNSNNFRILATSTQNISQTLNNRYHQKHLNLQLEGICSSQISSCISKMYASLYGSETARINNEKVEIFISELLTNCRSDPYESVKSPEILSHVFFHWLMQSKKEYSYTTKTQLFLTTHELLCLKLLEKIGSKSQTKIFEQKLCFDKLNIFFDEIFRIAYQMFENNKLELESSIFHELIDICKRLELPHSILKEILCIRERRTEIPLRNFASIAFPSVSLQVFYCAMHITSMFSSKECNLNILNEVFVENMAKRNLLIMLMKFVIGIMAFRDIIKLECNIKSIFHFITKYHKQCTTSLWLEICEETRCHSTVMFEARVFMGNTWTLEDSQISAGLITMLQNHPPKQISLTVCKPPKEIYFLNKALEVCSRIADLEVSLHLYNNFWVDKLETCDEWLATLLKHKLVCLESFAGKLTPEFLLKLPVSLKRLALHIRPEDITILNSSLIKLKNLMLLYVNLDINFEFPANQLPRIKIPSPDILFYVDIWNIEKSVLNWALDAVFSFSRAYCRLALRKTTLDYENTKRFLEGLRDRRIHVDSLIIGSTQTFTEDEGKYLMELANSFECSEVKLIKI